MRRSLPSTRAHGRSHPALPRPKLSTNWASAPQKSTFYPQRRLVPVVIAAWFLLSVLLLLEPRIRALSLLPNDWQVWTWVPGWMAEGQLYARDHWIVWSPPANWILAFIIVPAGYAAWWAAHLIAVVTLRDWPLIGLTFGSVPFWADAMNGQTITFAFVAGVWALRGSRIGALAFLALAVLIPRPLVVPLTLWLLWRQPWTRLPFLGMGGAVVLAALLSGDLLPWLGNMLAIGRDNYIHFANLSPTKVIGAWWLLVGVPLAAWLTWKGRVGLAGLAISPYVLPFYLLVLLWEWPALRSTSSSSERAWRHGRGTRPVPSSSASDLPPTG